MNELIVIQPKQIGNEEVNAVDARDLHANLGVKKKFADWVKYNIQKLSLIEGIDFITVPKIGTGGKFDSTEYILTLDAGKHIAMMTNTITAHSIRTYFIEYEKTHKKAALPPSSPLALAELMLSELKSQSAFIQQVANSQMQANNEIEHIKATRRAEHHQIKAVYDAVHAKAQWFVDKHNVPYAKAVSKTWILLKNRFQVATYHMLLSSQVDDAIKFVNTLALGHLATV